MKAFIRSLFIFLLIFSSVGPYLHGKPVHADGVSEPINLPFKPNDTAIDPNKPVIYATKLGSKTLYAVNFSTGEIKTLTLPYPAERLDFNNNKLYVTQLKMSHDHYNFGPYSGAIAEVDLDSFTLSNVLDINQDPYDIAVDNNGYIYISPGSGQWGNIKVYSMKDKKEIVQTVGYTSIYEKTNIFYNAETSKVYGIDTTLGPIDIEAFEVVDGIIKNHYDSPYHGDYSLDVSAKFSPDGQTLYNTGGFAFELATYQSGDMTYRLSFGKKYNDFEFSVPLGLTFAAGTTTGIDVYQYDTKTFLYSIRKDLSVQNLHIQNGVLVTINKDSSGNYFIETMKADTPTDPSTPVPPKAIELLQSASLTWNEDTAEFDYYDDFYNGVQDVELDSFFGFQFNQNIDLKDDTKMMITGPEGIVATAGWTEDDILYISTGILKGSTSYTLTIKKDAISGAEGQTLANDMVIKFKTASNWEQYDGKWYYYDPEIGDYVTGWKNVSGTWYYFNADYEMQTGWQKIKNVWYYFAGSGAMKTGWLKLGTTWYYFNGSGAMKTGWLQVGKTWYYFNGSGAMKTGWVQIGKTWYYFYNTGAMAYNTKIGGYKLGPTGAMIK